ncbi:MAG: hypothetical protein Q8O55_06895 [Dehalococcoidales bacterium]|nr:hypothetical protein [Dehalococcoidales bacterium]
MGFYNVIQVLNRAKLEGIFRNYAIMGGYAVNYYIEPTFTSNIDTLVLVASDADYTRVFDYFTQKGYKMVNLYVVIDDTQVQFFPSTISPLYESAVINAQTVEFRDTTTRIVTAEDLVALLLVSYRPKDKIRIMELLKVVNEDSLWGTVRRYDSEQNPIFQRLKEILGRNK